MKLQWVCLKVKVQIKFWYIYILLILYFCSSMKQLLFSWVMVNDIELILQMQVTYMSVKSLEFSRKRHIQNLRFFLRFMISFRYTIY